MTADGASITFDADRVVKRYIDRAWLAREPGLAAREAAALELLAGAELPFATPKVLSVDGDTIVMTRLPGSPQWDPPSIERLAEVGVALHEIVTPAGFHRFRRYGRIDAVPEWTSRARLWERAIEVADRARVDDATTSFIHRDHHAGNVLWVGEEVSGVVDVVEACAGPTAIDAARVRLNLVRHVGLDAAVRYAGCPGVVLDPRWDLVDAIDMVSSGEPAEWIEPFVAAALGELG